MFRDPPRLAACAAGGAARGTAETCGDADDVFVDARRGCVYVSCGARFIDVFDRSYLAARAQGREPAAIWEFRPAP